jgi:hypothetical protein
MKTIKKIQIDLHHKDDTTNGAIIIGEETDTGKCKVYSGVVKEMEIEEKYNKTIAYSNFGYTMAQETNKLLQEGYIVGHIY